MIKFQKNIGSSNVIDKAPLDLFFEIMRHKKKYVFLLSAIEGIFYLTL
jgi:hypothetical protein